MSGISKYFAASAAWGNAVLASGPGDALARVLAKTYNKNSNDYDTAIDSGYNATHIGGSRLHHLLDGQHSLWGAFGACRNVKSDDSIFSELWGAVEHLLRDTMSVSGIQPFFHLTRGEWEAVAGATASVGIRKTWLADVLTVNGPELLGSGLATVSLIFIRKDSGRHASCSGAFLVSALVSANPVLLLASLWPLKRVLTGGAREVTCWMRGACVASGIILLTSMPIHLLAITALGVMALWIYRRWFPARPCTPPPLPPPPMGKDFRYPGLQTPAP